VIGFGTVVVVVAVVVVVDVVVDDVVVVGGVVVVVVVVVGSVSAPACAPGSVLSPHAAETRASARITMMS